MDQIAFSELTPIVHELGDTEDRPFLEFSGALDRLFSASFWTTKIYHDLSATGLKITGYLN